MAVERAIRENPTTEDPFRAQTGEVVHFPKIRRLNILYISPLTGATVNAVGSIIETSRKIRTKIEIDPPNYPIVEK